MNYKLWIRYILCVFFVFGLIACNNNVDTDSSSGLATVFFSNRSSFDVRIYRNSNPEQDPAAYIGTAVRNSPALELKLAPSGAGEVGCTFYLRYQLPLPESQIPGVNNQGVIVGAAPTWDNIPEVIRANQTYTIQIDQPAISDLRFVNGYITVQNLNTNRVWLERGNSPQYRKDNNALWLNPGDIGFYEIAITPGQESMPANMFHVRDEQSKIVTIEPFTLSQGNLYWFEYSQSGVNLREKDGGILDILGPFR